jgi:hypothetical protein
VESDGSSPFLSKTGIVYALGIGIKIAGVLLLLMPGF